MAKWCLNHLTGSITAEKSYASSYGNWPLNDPPFRMGGDRIAVGDSEVRNDLAVVLMREMSGISYGTNVQKGLRVRPIVKSGSPAFLMIQGRQVAEPSMS
jgi:hypothetical protein